jgi:hypothetical protein
MINEHPHLNPLPSRGEAELSESNARVDHARAGFLTSQQEERGRVRNCSNL